MSYLQFLTEEQNKHLNHIQDEMFYTGTDGLRRSIDYLRGMRDGLAGRGTSKHTTSLKLDGAPSLIAGIHPEDGKFFIAKKSIFTAGAKLYKTDADIDADTSGDLAEKLKIALKHLPEIGIKNVIQGDFLFTNSDLKHETIDGIRYITFTPNTLTYAVPEISSLGTKIKRAKMGIVWHTSYTGNNIKELSAQFNTPITDKLKTSPNVWYMDSHIKDFSGFITMTKEETDQVTDWLSKAGTEFRQIKAESLQRIQKDNDLRIRILVYINGLVREGQILTNVTKNIDDMLAFTKDYYEKKALSFKTEKTQERERTIGNRVASGFDEIKDQLEHIFLVWIYLYNAKIILLNKMKVLNSLSVFYKTNDGYEVSPHEGIVVADHLGQNALKLVDQLTFSTRNFNNDSFK